MLYLFIGIVMLVEFLSFLDEPTKKFKRAGRLPKNESIVQYGHLVFKKNGMLK